MFTGAMVGEILSPGMARGLGEQDYSSVITVFEDWAGVSYRASRAEG